MSGLIQAIRLFKLTKQGALKNFHTLTRNQIKPRDVKSVKNIGHIRSFSSQLNNLQKSKLPGVLLKSSLGFGFVGTVYYCQNNIKYNLADLKDIFNSDNFKVLIGYFIKFAECDVERNHRRTDHYVKTVGLTDKNAKRKNEPAFDWYEFFRMIWKEKFYFFAAVAVSFFFC